MAQIVYPPNSTLRVHVLNIWGTWDLGTRNYSTGFG